LGRVFQETVKPFRFTENKENLDSVIYTMPNWKKFQLARYRLLTALRKKAGKVRIRKA
jgi:hypothetical protein